MNRCLFSSSGRLVFFWRRVGLFFFRMRCVFLLKSCFLRKASFLVFLWTLVFLRRLVFFLEACFSAGGMFLILRMNTAYYCIYTMLYLLLDAADSFASGCSGWLSSAADTISIVVLWCSASRGTSFLVD